MKQQSSNKHDKCVLCGEKTEYAEMDQVSARNFYVDGSGQLCQACFDEECHYERKNAK